MRAFLCSVRDGHPDYALASRLKVGAVKYVTSAVKEHFGDLGWFELSAVGLYPSTTEDTSPSAADALTKACPRYLRPTGTYGADKAYGVLGEVLDAPPQKLEQTGTGCVPTGGGDANGAIKTLNAASAASAPAPAPAPRVAPYGTGMPFEIALLWFRLRIFVCSMGNLFQGRATAMFGASRATAQIPEFQVAPWCSAALSVIVLESGAGLVFRKLVTLSEVSKHVLPGVLGMATYGMFCPFAEVRVSFSEVASTMVGVIHLCATHMSQGGIKPNLVWSVLKAAVSWAHVSLVPLEAAMRVFDNLFREGLESCAARCWASSAPFLQLSTQEDGMAFGASSSLLVLLVSLVIRLTPGGAVASILPWPSTLPSLSPSFAGLSPDAQLKAVKICLLLGMTRFLQAVAINFTVISTKVVCKEHIAGSSFRGMCKFAKHVAHVLSATQKMGFDNVGAAVDWETVPTALALARRSLTRLTIQFGDPDVVSYLGADVVKEYKVCIEDTQKAFRVMTWSKPEGAGSWASTRCCPIATDLCRRKVPANPVDLAPSVALVSPAVVGTTAKAQMRGRPKQAARKPPGVLRLPGRLLTLARIAVELGSGNVGSVDKITFAPRTTLDASFKPAVAPKGRISSKRKALALGSVLVLAPEPAPVPASAFGVLAPSVTEVVDLTDDVCDKAGTTEDAETDTDIDTDIFKNGVVVLDEEGNEVECSRKRRC